MMNKLFLKAVMAFVVVGLASINFAQAQYSVASDSTNTATLDKAKAKLALEKIFADLGPAAREDSSGRRIGVSEDGERCVLTFSTKNLRQEPIRGTRISLRVYDSSSTNSVFSKASAHFTLDLFDQRTEIKSMDESFGELEVAIGSSSGSQWTRTIQTIRVETDTNGYHLRSISIRDYRVASSAIQSNETILCRF